MSSVAPPGGESFLHASERFDDALKSIMESNDGNIAIISHSGVIRGWLHHYGGHDEDMFSIPVPCASIVSLICDGNTINRAIAGTRAVLTPGVECVRNGIRFSVKLVAVLRFVYPNAPQHD